MTVPATARRWSVPATVVDQFYVVRLRGGKGYDRHGLHRRVTRESRHSGEEKDPNLLHLHTYQFRIGADFMLLRELTMNANFMIF